MRNYENIQNSHPNNSGRLVAGRLYQESICIQAQAPTSRPGQENYGIKISQALCARATEKEKQDLRGFAYCTPKE